MPWHDVIQNTPEWLALRRGRVTASMVHAIMAKRKKGTGELAIKTHYRNALVSERLTQLTVGCYVSQALEWGIEQQPFAQAAYEVKTGNDASNGGFFVHDTIDGFGASPDFLVGDDGLGEIKCLNTENHLEIVRTGIVPEEFCWQMLGELACDPNRKWIDFVSYDSRVQAHHLQMFIQRYERTAAMDPYIAEMESEVSKFLVEVEESLSGLDRAARKRLPPRTIFALGTGASVPELAQV